MFVSFFQTTSHFRVAFFLFQYELWGTTFHIETGTVFACTLIVLPSLTLPLCAGTRFEEEVKGISEMVHE